MAASEREALLPKTSVAFASHMPYGVQAERRDVQKPQGKHSCVLVEGKSHPSRASQHPSSNHPSLHILINFRSLNINIKPSKTKICPPNIFSFQIRYNLMAVAS